MLQEHHSGELPLRGIRILEIAHLLAGPSVTSLLAELGAEVIKVEQPKTGDYSRHSADLGPSIWLDFNKNKRSIAINLKNEEGKKIVYKLAETSDAIVENYAPGALDKLGLGFEKIRDVNPSIIYCSVKGFPSNSPYQDRPGLDAVAQAIGGLMSVTGEPGRPPVRIGTSAVDVGAGAYAALAIAACLRRKEHGGKAIRLEVSLMDTAVYWNSMWITYFTLYNKVQGPIGSAHPMWGGPYKVFKSSDRKWVFIGVTSDAHWVSFCKAMGLEKLSNDPKFATNDGRARKRPYLDRRVASIVSKMKSKKVVDRLIKADVPCAPVRRMDEIANDDDLLRRGILTEITIREGKGKSKKAKVAMAPIISSEFQIKVERDPPKVGEQTQEILRSIGYDEKEIQTLESEGAIGLPTES